MIIQNISRGVFLKRYKRFITDIDLHGRIEQAHCPNSGSMKTLTTQGAQAWVSHVDDPKRKLKLTLQVLGTENGLACVNTMLSNHIVKEGILEGKAPELSGFSDLRTEVKYGEEKSRIDILLEGGGPPCYVEVKNVTLMETPGLATFPDAKTTRGQKHLRELAREAQQGRRACVFFLVNRTDCDRFDIAANIDPDYAREMKAAMDAGVTPLAYRTHITPHEGDAPGEGWIEITLGQAAPVLFV